MSIGTLRPDSTIEIALNKGRYLFTFSQNGMWQENGLAYLDFTGYTQGSYFSWICGNLSSLLTVTINSSGITITASSSLGAGINISCNKLKAV